MWSNRDICVKKWVNCIHTYKLNPPKPIIYLLPRLYANTEAQPRSAHKSRGDTCGIPLSENHTHCYKNKIQDHNNIHQRTPQKRKPCSFQLSSTVFMQFPNYVSLPNPNIDLRFPTFWVMRQFTHWLISGEGEKENSECVSGLIISLNSKDLRPFYNFLLSSCLLRVFVWMGASSF